MARVSKKIPASVFLSHNRHPPLTQGREKQWRKKHPPPAQGREKQWRKEHPPLLTQGRDFVPKITRILHSVRQGQGLRKTANAKNTYRRGIFVPKITRILHSVRRGQGPTKKAAPQFTKRK